MTPAVRLSPVARSQATAPQATAPPRRISVFGSTGSIGTQTLDLVGRNPAAYQVVALTANKNVDLLVAQAKQFLPHMVVIGDESLYPQLKQELAGYPMELAAGTDAVVDAARRDSDWVMAGIVGAAGLASTLAALERGAVVAFANKETLVCAGPLMLEIVKKSGAKLIPVDSEHNAIWQVFDSDNRHAITRLILTASGGPFRQMSRAEMATVTPEQAVKHPVWSMGSKISIDSATMMNKGLELIEAHYLFTMPEKQIDILVHPQSIIHSMVEYTDGSVLAQLGTPDMRTPIGYALAWPQRMETPAARLDLAKVGQLTFEAPDNARFPALPLARDALMKGGTAPLVINAVNEVAVAAFLAGKIPFLRIVELCQQALADVPHRALSSMTIIADADAEARAWAAAKISS